MNPTSAPGPAPIPAEQLLRQLQWRYATKKFDPARVISPGDWRALEEALVLTPSSYGLQPWKFLVISDPATRERLVPISWKQRQLAEASHVVVFAIRKHLDAAQVDRFIERTVAVRGGSVESLAGYRRVICRDVIDGPRSLMVNEWAQRQVYIALGNFMTSAALLGIDTCPLEGIEPAAYDQLLGLPARGFATVVACAAGYRAADDRYAELAKVRFPVDEMVEHVVLPPA